jgi:hypothetical protein
MWRWGESENSIKITIEIENMKRKKHIKKEGDSEISREQKDEG